MNTKRIKQTAFIMFILALLALYASLRGIFDQNLYADVVSAGTMPHRLIWGSIAQDIISVPITGALMVLSIFLLKKPGYKTLVAATGLAWYLFYAFGLYVIQGQYTAIYIIYLGIWSLSIYGMIWGLMSFFPHAANSYVMPKTLEKCIIGYLLLTLLVLVPGWLIKIAPDIANRTPGATYAVFILDLCVVFPAFGITIYRLLKKLPFSNILAGISLIKGWTLCLSWGFSEISAPFVGQPITYDMAVISNALTVIGFILYVLYCLKTSTQKLTK